MCKLALDCAHVNLKAHQVHQATSLSETLAERLFAQGPEDTGTLQIELRQGGTQTYSASLVPACGTSLFMDV